MSRTCVVLLILFGGLLAACGSAGEDGTSCTVTDNGDGTSTISCTDGTSTTVGNGEDGLSCTVTDNGDGTSTIACEDGTTVTISDGQSGGSCTIVDNGDGTRTITCDDGTTVVISDGEDGSGNDFRITDLHGGDALAAAEAAEGKFMADAVITSATADAAGVATVNFTVATRDGDPLLNVAAISANIARLAAPSGGESFDKWVPYIYRTETVTGDTYPNPAGTTAEQAYRESNGVLTNHGDGSYTYVFSHDLTAAPVAYERDKLTRVAIMMGGHTGATADAWLDFVPDGSAAPASHRDVIRTEACQGCHGETFAGHGGDRLHVEICATCHVPGSNDAQGGESLDLKQMIHKIHMGGELATVAGPDGNAWATADNGSYALFGYGNSKHEWWKVEFPAVIENCTKCHDGAGADADRWETRPSREACESCHDTLDLESAGTDHPAGQQLDDDNCSTCHRPGGLFPIADLHDWTVKDPRNIPEFTAAMSMTAPANGQYYAGSEAPILSLVIQRNGTPIDHRILRGAAQGCVPSGDPLACAADTDGKFAASSFFVSGPRDDRNPVLTTKARAQILAATVGPFTFSTATSLTLNVDQGVDIYLDDDWNTRLAGVVTVAVPAGTYTTDQLVTLLGASTTFNNRAIAFNQAGRLGLRSRNKGKVHALQLVAGDVTTAVFAGDVAVKVPGGSTASNTLASAATSVGAIPAATDDAKVTLFADHIEYQLDPVGDLVPGTYLATLELGQLGRIDANNYRTPSVLKYPFQVGTATPELQVAGNCDSCHESAGGKGFILDPSRHNKIFDETALDQCGACHDYQPQDPNCPLGNAACGASTFSGWTGSRPISKRVHAVHNGSALQHPLATVDYTNGDPVAGRNWDITFPQDVRNCQSCHEDGTSSGTWATSPERLACSGCHDGDAAATHMKLATYDPTPTMPWSGDERESCATCH
jgi:OmcA/MtrC family decaheme c-type cytochrome